MSAVLVLAFCALMVLAVPVAHAMVLAASVALLWDGQVPLLLVAQSMFAQTQSFPLLALPFFIMAGSLMMGGKLGDELLRFADLELSPSRREATRGGEPVELTRTEFNLLELFLRNPRQVLTRSVIFERVWGYDFGFASNSLDVYIGYLRRKAEAGGKPRLIQTVRGVGYALRET